VPERVIAPYTGLFYPASQGEIAIFLLKKRHLYLFNLRVGLFGNAAQSGWYVSPKAKYMRETDSEQVPEGKMKRTLRRESKAPETVGREAMGVDIILLCSRFLRSFVLFKKRQHKFAFFILYFYESIK